MPFPNTNDFSDSTFDAGVIGPGGSNDPSSVYYDPTTASTNEGSGSSTGSQILGWLGLGTQVANTVVNATRGSTPVIRRPGTTITGSTSQTTIIVVVLLAVLGILLLARK